MAVVETSRTYTISLPADVARKAEETAAREGQSISEVVESALGRGEEPSFSDWLADIGEYAASRNPGYTEEDIPRLIREVRVEHAAELSSK